MKDSSTFFPIYTEISSDPEIICAPIHPDIFNYPFFNDGVNKLWTSECSIKKLAIDEVTPTNRNMLELKGFIYHTSHCGSTLLARMLNTSSEVRVISEPEAINGLLLAHLFYNLSEDLLLEKLDRIIELYRQPLKNEKYLIIKMTSWNVFFRELIHKLFPHKPWIYLDRESEEVVNSLMKSDGGMENWWHHSADSVLSYFVGPKDQFAGKRDYLTKLVKEHRRQSNKYENDRLLSLKYRTLSTNLNPLY